MKYKVGLLIFGGNCGYFPAKEWRKNFGKNCDNVKINYVAENFPAKIFFPNFLLRNLPCKEKFTHEKIVGQGVPEISLRSTDKQTHANYFRYVDDFFRIFDIT